MGWLTGWNYRKSITLSRASGAVTNYQMKLLLGESSGAAGEDVDCGGLCLSTFNDIRFTNSGGETLLDYWIESISGITPNRLATIWIEVDSIGTGATTFYLYYGNSGAASVSNGNNTFPFFDHFDDDLSKWTINYGSPALSSSIVNNSGTTNERETTTATYGVNYAFRVYASLSETNGAGLTFDEHHNILFDSSTLKFITYRSDWGAETNTNLGATYTPEWNIFEIRRNASSNVQVAINDSVIATHTTNFSTSEAGGRIGIGSTTSASAQADWALIRQYLSPEPAWGTWGSPEGFFNVTCLSALTMQETLPVPQQNVGVTILDAMEISDPCAISGLFSISVLDSLVMSEIVQGIVTIASSSSDGFSISDISDVLKFIPRTVTDGLSASDAAASLVSLIGTSTEQINISDIPNSQAVFQSSSADGITLQELLSVINEITRNTTDGVAISDISSGVKTWIVTVADVMTISHTSSGIGVLQSASSDSVTTTDTPAGNMIAIASVLDAAILSDVIAGLVNYILTLSDGFTTADSNSGPITIILSVSEGITLSDVATSLGVFIASFSDTTDISDVTMRWNPDGIAFLSFTATAKRWIYNANPGR